MDIRFSDNGRPSLYGLHKEEGIFCLWWIFLDDHFPPTQAFPADLADGFYSEARAFLSSSGPLAIKELYITHAWLRPDLNDEIFKNLPSVE
jgi:hypothetical protein